VQTTYEAYGPAWDEDDVGGFPAAETIDALGYWPITPDPGPREPNPDFIDEGAMGCLDAVRVNCPASWGLSRSEELGTQ
jgi:hypothetical protein